MRSLSIPLFLLLIYVFSPAGAVGSEQRQFTFAWPYVEGDDMAPRGGNTQGPDIELDTGISDAWLALQNPDLSKFERDRQAILAMVGPYRASFDFIETAGFTLGFKPDRPYQSWGTEYVYMIEDKGDYISLQHILVMFIKQEDGSLMGPIVVKHWRQDWQFEDRDLHVYAGHNRWQQKRLGRREVRGTWTQAVFQVDDSPRYESIGSWQHTANFSSWTSAETWRPLPRREFSVRDDYDVLVGTNQHTITPTGWIHKEDNLKVRLTDEGEIDSEPGVLALEAGLNRYERIINHDFSAGDEYWDQTKDFWADVRHAWRDIYARQKSFTIKGKVDDKRLFQVMFDYAGKLDSASYNQTDSRAFVSATLTRFLED